MIRDTKAATPGAGAMREDEVRVRDDIFFKAYELAVLVQAVALQADALRVLRTLEDDGQTTRDAMNRACRDWRTPMDEDECGTNLAELARLASRKCAEMVDAQRAVP